MYHKKFHIDSITQKGRWSAWLWRQDRYNDRWYSLMLCRVQSETPAPEDWFYNLVNFLMDHSKQGHEIWVLVCLESWYWTPQKAHRDDSLWNTVLGWWQVRILQDAYTLIEPGQQNPFLLSLSFTVESLLCMSGLKTSNLIHYYQCSTISAYH